MEEQDTKPWYRYFWPWFIIALLGCAVSASLYTVSLAVRTTDSLIVTSEDGMNVVTERNIAAERRAQELGLAATLQIDAGTGTISASITSRAAAAWPADITLLFSHPTDFARDRSVTLSAVPGRADGTPVWTGVAGAIPSGRWYLVLSAAEDWRLSGTWSGAGETVLRPAADGG
jgi:hypothetical protein